MAELTTEFYFSPIELFQFDFYIDTVSLMKFDVDDGLC